MLRLDLPIDRFDLMRLQKGVGLGKVAAAGKPVIHGIRAGVGGGQDEMRRFAQQSLLGLGVPSPQQEDDRGGQGIEQPDDLIGQDLPSFVRV